MMHNWDGGWGAGGWLLMGFGMLLFWALVVIGVVWLVRYTAAGQRTRSDRSSERGEVLDKRFGPPPNARDILDERYARGEINDDEYRARRDTLAAP
jgi:putative membrane protein